jgi:hypothetical protein
MALVLFPQMCILSGYAEATEPERAFRLHHPTDAGTGGGNPGPWESGGHFHSDGPVEEVGCISEEAIPSTIYPIGDGTSIREAVGSRTQEEAWCEEGASRQQASFSGTNPRGRASSVDQLSRLWFSPCRTKRTTIPVDRGHRCSGSRSGGALDSAALVCPLSEVGGTNGGRCLARGQVRSPVDGLDLLACTTASA